MTIDVRIMGVPERMDNIRQTQARLDISDSHIFIDTEHRGVVWNAKRAWLHPTQATHVLVLQDDIELCDDFLAICHRMVEAHPDKIFFLSSFLFRSREQLFGSPEQLPTPYISPYVISGQGIIVPAKYVAECIESFPPYAYADDFSIFQWAKQAGVVSLTTVPAILQHIGDDSTIGHNEIRRSVFYDSNPQSVNWDNKEFADWTGVYREEQKERVDVPIEIAGLRVRLNVDVPKRISGSTILRSLRTEQPCDDCLVVDTERCFEYFLQQNIVDALTKYLIEKDVLMLNAFAISINGNGVLLIGDKRKSLAYLLKTARGYDVGVGMGDIQCVALTENGATIYPTPFGYIMKWEEKRVIHFDKILVVGDGSDHARVLDSKEALAHIIRAAVLPKDMQGKLWAMQLCGRLAAQCKVAIFPYKESQEKKEIISFVSILS